ncbi:prestin-like isoform X2 [Procambarus clarkii]|uniref:prestin-like isoform X2 n=1 Tax=Procambarus clarkii TaxID=6728 RepID=UPI003743426B
MRAAREQWSDRSSCSASEAETCSTSVSGMGHSEIQDGGEVCVVRPSLNITQRASKYHYCPPPDPGILESMKIKAKESCSCSGSCLVSAVTARVPILSWLPAYSIRSSLFGDVVSGVTVAIMHIPQGMAYALLGGLPPITGIYMAFFPLLVYACLGTSRHCSVGTFAVVCLMTGKLVGELATEENGDSSLPLGNITNSLLVNSTQKYTANEVAAIVALMNGVAEIILGLLQLGSLCVFLSDMLVSGFTTGAAIHVLTSQIKYLFGIKVQRYSGPFKIIYTYKDIIGQLLTANPAAMVISGVTITVLAFNNEIVKPWFRTKTKLPIPIELIAVILGTLASYCGNLHDNYDIRIVGDIPTGLPKPTPPPFELIPAVAVDSFIISIVAYTVSFSMAKIFAKRQNYDVDATQELYALGASNIFGSFFGCAPIAASLSRSLIQEAVGGVTQITSFICCSLLLFILLFVGPVFESLPNCVLSSIIVVALKGMFMQVKDLRRVWAVSRADALIWLASFLGVVIIDIDYGLLLGIVVSLLVLLGRSQQPKTALLGCVPNTDIYLDINKYSATVQTPTVSIFQFRGPIHFANSEYFRQQLMSVTGLVPSAITVAKLAQEQQLQANITTQEEANGNATIEDKKTSKTRNFFKGKVSKRKSEIGVTIALPEVQFLVIEMSGVSYTDSSGGNLLSQLCKEYKKAGITLCLAALSENVLETLEVCGTLKVLPPEHIFHSAHDAVMILTQADIPPALDDTATKL